MALTSASTSNLIMNSFTRWNCWTTNKEICKLCGKSEFTSFTYEVNLTQAARFANIRHCKVLGINFPNSNYTGRLDLDDLFR